VREVVQQSCGIVVPPRRPDAFAEALERLARDASMRREMGRRAREHMRGRYSTERLLADVTGLYEELLAER
jgi:glycosyltransferase involved in cell wall biosynthesis